MLTNNIFIFGFGYVASFLANYLTNLQYNIYGTSRDANKHIFYSALNYHLVDFTDPKLNSYLKSATHILITIPPSHDKDLVLQFFQPQLIELADNLKWIGYLSSTGVYGDHKGAWVDEITASKNITPRNKARLQAEQAWLKFAKKYKLPLHIFRIASIYGPQRNVLYDLTQGKREWVFKENHYFSRIHVTDIVNALHASITQPKPLSIYNLADDLPAPSHEVALYAAQLLKIRDIKLIPFSEANLSPMLLDFYSSSRKVNNQKIKNELGIRLKYPNYKISLEEMLVNKEY